ncbi:MAG: pilin [Myxococcales bacterium]|nr:pilin [Myxococcales bacterium]
MHTYKNSRKRGFTLVELMIVVAIIGVLAALAIYGVRRYLASAKTSEAKNSIGAIARAATAAFERENAPAETLAEGVTSANLSHSLCLAAAAAVPAAGVPQGKKYQPITAQAKDYDATSQTVGWKCVKFGINEPHYYQYTYKRDANAVAGGNPAACTAPCYEAAARGDLDGDAAVFGIFAVNGNVNLATQALKKATQVFIQDEYE